MKCSEFWVHGNKAERGSGALGEAEAKPASMEMAGFFSDMFLVFSINILRILHYVCF